MVGDASHVGQGSPFTGSLHSYSIHDMIHAGTGVHENVM